MAPLLVPLDEVVSHDDESLVAIHGHPLIAVTENDPVLPLTGAVSELGEKLPTVQVAWFTVTACPATVTVALRVCPLELGSIDKTVVPFPDPDAPEVMLIQLADSDAVQLHPAPAVTLMLVLCPATIAFTVVVLSVYVHGPSWVRVNVAPGAVMCPVRLDPVPLAATV